MTTRRWTKARNLLGFWLLGLCNNFAYTIMLSAAGDIVDRFNGKSASAADDQCEAKITSRNCAALSTGAVLLADVLPTLFVKLTFPFFVHRIPYGTRHFLIVALQAASFFLVAFSGRIWVVLFGVGIASFGYGLGEISYLALSSHFHGHSIAAYSAGTGAAGILSALGYAALTESHLANLSPKTTLLIMLIMPVIFAISFWIIICHPISVHRVDIRDRRTFIAPQISHLSEKSPDDVAPLSSTFFGRFRLMVPLLRFMIPLVLVYYGEYLINQGIVQMIKFQCSKGWNLSASSQYRWFQVLYQLGVFISRSSVLIIKIPPIALPFLAVLQLVNAAFALTEAIFSFAPHIAVVFAVILYEGLLGGATFANAFHSIHTLVAPANREFSLSVASVADSLGIVAAAFSSIPVHNFVCLQPIH